MALPVFQLPPGLTYDTPRRAIWSTDIQTSASGDEYRRSRWSYPIWELDLTFEVLDEAPDLQSGAYDQLFGLFNRCNGAAQPFLFEDLPRSGAPRNQVTGQVLGMGDGQTTRFQLLHNLGGFIEPIRDLKGAATVRVGGVATNQFTVDGNGGIVLTAAAPVGQEVDADFSFYYRCRFKDDQMSLAEIAEMLWATDATSSNGTITIRTLKVPQRSSP